MSDAPNFKKHALVFVLFYLASRGLFAAASVLSSTDGCGCLAGMADVAAWPAFGIGLGGLLVTAVRWRMRATGDDCPVCPTLLFLPPILGCVWATLDGFGYWARAASVGSDVALAAASIAAVALIVSLRRDRRASGPPVARVVD